MRHIVNTNLVGLKSRCGRKTGGDEKHVIDLEWPNSKTAKVVVVVVVKFYFNRIAVSTKSL